MVPTWLRDYYDDVDNLRMDAFLARNTDTATLTFGNHPPAVGKAQIRAAINAFWDTIHGLRHNFTHVHQGANGVTIVEATVDYTRKDGAVVSARAASVLVRDGDLVTDLRVYVDLAPVYA